MLGKTVGSQVQDCKVALKGPRPFKQRAVHTHQMGREGFYTGRFQLSSFGGTLSNTLTLQKDFSEHPNEASTVKLGLMNEKERTKIGEEGF